MADDKKTIPGERTLLISDNGVLSLTNYRVKYDSQGNGKSKFVSITLESVSSCGLITRSRPALLVLAAIALVGALAQHDSVIRNGLFFVGFILAVAYFWARSGVITVSSNGGEGIVVPADGMSRDAIVVFLEAVMEAKLRFIGKESEELIGRTADDRTRLGGDEHRKPNIEGSGISEAG